MDEAISILREITALTVDGHPAFPAPFTGLAVALERRFNLNRHRRPDATDLDEAFAAIDRAIELSRPDDVWLVARRTFRMRFLGTKYDHTDDPALLDEAIRLGASLEDAEHHPDRQALHAGLAHLYGRRYDRSSALSDIEAAIRHGRRAVELSGGHPGHLDDLGNMLRRWGEDRGDVEALREARTCHHRALATYPDDHIDRLAARNSLGRTLAALGKLTRDNPTLDEAVTELRGVVSAAKERSHPDWAGFQQNLALALGTRSQVRNDAADRHEQEELLREAASALDSRPGVVRDLQSDLGGSLRRRGEETDDPALVDEGIDAQRQAAKRFDLGDPASSLLQFQLATSLFKRYRSAPAAGDRAEAFETFRSLASTAAAPPWMRVRSARRWGELAAGAGDWVDTAQAYGLAIELLPRLAAQDLGRGDQERHLMQESGLVGPAVAAALNAGQLGRAVETFEQGRGVLTAHALALRTEVGDLESNHPGLAWAFHRGDGFVPLTTALSF